MYIAAANGRTDVIRALYSARADVNQRDWCVFAAILTRATAHIGSPVHSRFTHSEFQTPLWAAGDKGHISAVSALIELGANVSSVNR